MWDLETVWASIVSLAGEAFRQIKGGEFTYAVAGNYLRLSRTNRSIPKSDIAKSLPYVPFESTTVVNHLAVQAPSYVYAILMDPRVRTH